MPDETKNQTSNAAASQLIGSQAQPTTLDSTTKIDIDVDKTLLDNIIEAGLSGGLDTTALDRFTSMSNARDQMYQLIDTMAQDATIAAILKTYTENVCEPADNGHIVWCESNNTDISRFVNYLLNIMNVDKNIYTWAYSLLKYGDIYLKLFRESDYVDKFFSKDKIKSAYSAKTRLNEDAQQESVKIAMHSVNDAYSGYVEMVPDPNTMFELTKFGRTYGYVETPNMPGIAFGGQETFTGIQGVTNFNFRMKSSDVNVYQADDFVHACLEDNFTRYPETVQLFQSDSDYASDVNAQSYNVRRGKSILYDSYKIWREKALLENAALLNRITRSSIVRKVSVEVGDMPKEQVKKLLRRVKELFEQKTAISVGNGMAEYQNPGPVENNIYFATHGGQGQVTVDSVGGDVDVKSLADLDWWNNKLYGSFGIPKQYFGWTDDSTGFNGGTSLTIISSIFAKGVKRVQNALIQMLTDAINLILFNRGCKSYLNNFVLKMKAPVTQEELDYRSNLSDRITAISNVQGLFTDVENKVRRLEILKVLVGQLNYGDEVMQAIDEEIAAEEKAQKDAAAEAEAEATASVEETAPETETQGEDADLNLAPMPDSEVEESFDHGEGELLAEGNKFSALLEDDDDLPTPDELNQDFTKNN